MTNFLQKTAYLWNLVSNLAFKDLKIKYKQTYLRGLWAVIQPLFLMLITTLIFSYLAKVKSEGVPYPVFNFSCMIFWSFFSTSITLSTKSLRSNRNLIQRVYFPKISLIFGSLGISFFDLSIAFIFLAGLTIFYGTGFGAKFALIFPVLFFQVLLIIGLSCFTSVLDAYLRDISNALPIILQAWMLASPVAYSIDMVPSRFKIAYLLNPMAGFLDSYRKILVHNQLPNPLYLGIAIIISLLIFFAGFLFFKSKESTLADIL